jgi:hypothetical protein
MKYVLIVWLMFASPDKEGYDVVAFSTEFDSYIDCSEAMNATMAEQEKKPGFAGATMECVEK